MLERCSTVPSLALLLLLLGTLQAAEAGAQSVAQETADAAADAQMRVNDAIGVVGKMKADPHAGELLAKAKGVVLIPHYLQAALVFGGRSGSGLLLVRGDARWTDPV